VTELPERPLDLTRLLEILADHGVEYTVIGGVAVQVHGHRRTTRDLDVIPDPRPENLRRLAAALAELDAHPRDLPGGPPDADQLAAAPVVPPLTTRHGQRCTFSTQSPGPPRTTSSAPARWSSASTAWRSPSSASTTSFSMKRAAGRPSDLADLAVLTAVPPG